MHLPTHRLRAFCFYLKILNDIVENHSGIEADDEVTDPALADLVLIAEMLGRAEDIHSENDDDMNLDGQDRDVEEEALLPSMFNDVAYMYCIDLG